MRRSWRRRTSRRVHPGDWLHVGTVVAAMVGKGSGLAALAVAGAAAKRHWSPGWVVGFASLLIGTIAALSVAQLAIPAPWVTAMLPVVALAGLVVALPGCAAAVRRSPSNDRIDAALGLYCGFEMMLLVVLCRSSSGAWINYGIPALIFAAALAARSLAVAADAMPRLGRAVSAVAAVAVLASVLMDAKVEVNRRRTERADLARIFASTSLPPSACFFADRPGLNRMSGRLEWVYDDWLYSAFESLKLAEPRRRWLRSMLGRSAAVRAVVLESDGNRVDGIPEMLPELGFVRAGRSGPVPRLDPRIAITRITMSETPSTKPDGRGWASAWVTAMVAVSAAATLGYWSFRGLDRRDTEAMESPLILSVARQLTVSPRELYGPYGESNPLVLIHAPLYYRAAGLLAWPLARAGLHPVDAARIAGRLISALSLAATMGAAYRLGRLGGLPPAGRAVVGAAGRRLAGPRRSALRRPARHGRGGAAELGRRRWRWSRWRARGGGWRAASVALRAVGVRQAAPGGGLGGERRGCRCGAGCGAGWGWARWCGWCCPGWRWRG